MATSKYSAGIHAANRLLKSMPEKVRKLYLDERSKNPRLAALKTRAREMGIPTQGARSHRLDDMAQGAAHQGVVIELTDLPNIDEAALRASVESALALGRKPLLLILVGVQDPHNLGACLRTAEAAAVDAVIVPRTRATGLTPAARKVASGAAEILPLVTVPSIARALDWIGSYGIRRIATSDAASDSLYACDYRVPTALVMGPEGDGLSPEIMQRCDQTIAIPMAGVVESLNVSVAAAVCLFEVVRQRSA